MRHLALALLLAAAAPAAADPSASWGEFRAAVAAACTALAEAQAPGAEVAVEVNPFGSVSYGVALVLVAVETGEERLGCVFEKATGEAELTAPFSPG